MAFSSKQDAINKLTSSIEDHTSTPLYLSDTNLDSNTIFYTDSAKTTTAGAGNYLIPTNNKSIYVTLDSNGKISGTPSVVEMSSNDSDWVDSQINIYTAGTVDPLTKNYLASSVTYTNIGTDMSLSSGLLTDSAWATETGNGGNKRWVINNGPLRSDAITSIDVSEMAGYDLLIYSGNHDGTKFVSEYAMQSFVHLAIDSGRSAIDGDKIYYFAPDYWIPTASHQMANFFRRMPDITPINNQSSSIGEKSFKLMEVYKNDTLYYNGSSRTSTILSSGVNLYANASNKSEKITFGFDATAFKTSIADVYGVLPSDVYAYGDPPIWTYRIATLIESLVLDYSTWSTGTSRWGIPYTQANPWRWEYNTYGTDPAHYFSSSAALFTQLYDRDSFWNTAEAHFNYEDGHVMLDSYNAGRAIALLVSESLKRGIDNSVHTPGTDPAPKLSGYAVGVYNPSWYGPTNQAWSNLSSGNYVSHKLYNDYKNLIIDNTYSASDILPESFTEGMIAAYSQSLDTIYCSNYQINVSTNQWYFYNLIGGYEISKKMLDEYFDTHSVNANHVKIQPYIYRFMEPNQVEATYLKKFKNSANQALPGRFDLAPSMWQSLGAWGFGLCDGITNWGASTTENYYDYAQADGGKYDGQHKQAENPTNKASHDWLWKGQYQIWQNKDIIEASTDWKIPDYDKGSNNWTTTYENIPAYQYTQEYPICRYKSSADGSEALVLCINPFSDGITKSTHTFRVPVAGLIYKTFTIDTWGHYTTVLRLKNITPPLT